MKLRRVAVSVTWACLLMGGVAVTRSPESWPDGARQAALFGVRSELVVLDVTVLDRGSRFVSGLSQQEFRIYEDGAPQAISVFSDEDRPAVVGLVIDYSGSMRNKRADVVAAAQAFARASNSRDELFIINFNEEVWFGLPPGMSFTTDIGLLTGALSTMRARGQTALYDAIDRALGHLDRSARDRRVLVVISDGSDNASSTKREQLFARVRKAETTIYSMGLYDEVLDERDLNALKQLSSLTGGEYFLPDSSQKAGRILERIAQDIRHSYTIGYVPTNLRRDGRYRTIRVTVDVRGRGNLKVRTRAGYVAPLGAQEGKSSPPH